MKREKMTLFKVKTKSITDMYAVQDKEGNTLYVDKISEDKLLECGYKKVYDEDQVDYSKADKYTAVATELIEKPSYVTRIRKLKDIPLKTAKDTKKSEMKSICESLLERSYVDVPEIGRVDAGREYLVNIDVLIDLCEYNGMQFRMYDNSFKLLYKSDLLTIKRALQLEGVRLKQLLWEKEQLIDNCTTVDEIRKIVW